LSRFVDAGFKRKTLGRLRELDIPAKGEREKDRLDSTKGLTLSGGDRIPSWSTLAN